MLRDSFGRVHDYLRISLTDRCNFNCLYCLPEPDSANAHIRDAGRYMSADEIFRLASVFVSLGVNKIRITGGEPLIRKDASLILENLGSLPVQLAITTNGTRIHDYISTFRKIGLQSVNISLDSMDNDTFFRLTGRNEMKKVVKNIELLLAEGFHPKINMVVLNGHNDHEIVDFVKWTASANVHVRFIEFMPFPGNHWRPEKVTSFHDMLDSISEKFPELEKLEDHPNDTTKKYRVPGYKGTFAVISTMTEPFCSGCNRLRLTADGKLRNCLFAKNETDLLAPLRMGADPGSLIADCLKEKAWQLGGNNGSNWGLTETVAHKRSMMGIGG